MAKSKDFADLTSEDDESGDDSDGSFAGSYEFTHEHEGKGWGN